MILTIFFGISGLGIMVFMHELGHFIGARLSGIEVEIFSLGWGKKLIGFDYKGTSYQISWFPIGGFCKMKGENPVKAETGPETGSFLAASPGKRILTAVAGPLANILFAVLVLTIIWWAGFNIYSDDSRIVLAADYSLDSLSGLTPAEAAGLKTGDRIVAINDQPVDKFQDILEKVATSPNEDLNLQVDRAGRHEILRVRPELDLQSGAGRIGVYAWRDPVIDRVRPGSSAGLAGIEPGDRVLSINGVKIEHTIDFFQMLKDRPDRVELTLNRGGSQFTRSMFINYSEDNVLDLGLTFRVFVFRSPEVGASGALVKGLEETWSTLIITLKGIRLLFRGINLRNAVAGPLRITYYVGSVARSGFSLGFSQGMISFFRFLCLLSVVLFVMNLLPIPAVDGGQIIIFLLEIIRGKPVPPRIVASIQVIGFSLLIGLVIIFTFSDILFFMGK